MDTSDWDKRIEALYDEQIDAARPAESVASMRAFLAQHPDAGALVPFELGGVHDSLGLEEEAVPLYVQALTEGLDERHAAQARIQLASTLRNLGRPDEAIALLSEPTGPEFDAARRAFLALALHSAGRHGEALRESLEALIPTLPAYRRALTAYAAELTNSD